MASTHSHTDGSAGISHYAAALGRRKIVMVLTFAAALATALPFVLGLPSVYKSTATVMVEGQMPEGSLQSGVGGAVDSRLQAIKQEAFSRANLTRLLDEFNLYPTLRGRVPTEALLAQIQKDIAIDFKSAESNGSRSETIAFTITVTGRDPETVAGVANRVASYYVAQNDRIRSGQATRTTEVLRQQMADTKKRLDGQEGRMKDFLTRHMGRLPQQVDANLLALNRLNGQLQFNSEQQSRLMERRQDIQKQIADLDMAAVSAASTTSTSDPVMKLAAARRELADLQSKFNERYPDVRDKKAEVDRMEREVASLNGRSAATSAVQGQKTMLAAQLKEVESKLDELSKDSSSIRSQSTSYEGRVESAPARGPEYDALSRDDQGTRDVYDQLLKRYDDARLVENLEHTKSGQEFRILDAALPPPFAAGPNRMRLLMLGFMLAIVLAVIAAIAADRLDTSFHTIDDLRSFTQVPVLASIPRIATTGEARSRRLRWSAVAAAAAVTLVLLASGAFHYAHGSYSVARLLLQVG
jgi:succinoglycan biosynthesis transport protein ExoP